MIKVSLLAAAAMLAPFIALAQPAPPTGPLLPQEYAVKFVCGRSSGDAASSFAAGTYFTAINVHNPTRAARFVEKVALAEIGLPGRMTDLRPGRPLRYDEVIEFNCDWISARLRRAGITPPDLFTGYVVLQSGSPLDVVAVYTASGREGVSTMHTERVPVRRVM